MPTGISKNKTQRHKRLLASGYLPDQLPPTFNTRDLAKFRDSLLKAYKKIPANNPKKPPEFQYFSVPATIYMPRYGKQDRKHHIINPINYFFLSKEISDNWIALRKILRKSKISASPLLFNWTDGRSLLPLDFELRKCRIADISVGNPFLLLTDVTRFYHSIYTHAIAWAVHTKAVAKKNRTLDLLGNRLDTLTRNAQDGQTIGVPVGPDTSRVLAELLGVAIDTSITVKEPATRERIMRFVDDVVIGCASVEAAERIKSIVRSELHQFELEMNEDKTSIVSVDKLDYSSWRHEIIALRPKFRAKQSALELYFDKVNILSSQFPNDNVLRYAIKVSRALFTQSPHWSVIEDFLLLSYRGNRTTLFPTVEILVNRSQTADDVDKSKISNFIQSTIPHLCEMDRHAEISWLLFLASEMEVPLARKYLERVSQTLNPISALQLCHLSSKGLVDKPINRTHWNAHLTPDGLRSEMWLYAYEATLKGWTGSTAKKFVLDDPFFGPLFKRKVSFFDIDAHIAKTAENVKKDIDGSIKLKLATAAYIADFDDEWENEVTEDEADTWADY